MLEDVYQRKRKRKKVDFKLVNVGP